MGCNEKCTASELTGLAEQNIEYCQGLMHVDFENSDVHLRNVCGALVMARVTYGQIKPREVSLATETETHVVLH